MTAALPVIGILGGTGALGKGLAIRWAAAGYPLVIGSRDAARAEAVAGSISAGAGAAAVRGMDNLAAARVAEIAAVTVPFASHMVILREVRAELSGKILIDTTVPLVPPKVATVQLPPEGSGIEKPPSEGQTTTSAARVSARMMSRRQRFFMRGYSEPTGAGDASASRPSRVRSGRVRWRVSTTPGWSM